MNNKIIFQFIVSTIILHCIVRAYTSTQTEKAKNYLSKSFEISSLPDVQKPLYYEGPKHEDLMISLPPDVLQKIGVENMHSDVKISSKADAIANEVSKFSTMANIKAKAAKDRQVAHTKNGLSKIHSTSAPSFTCQTLPTDYDPTYFCSGVVDYPFLVWNGLSIPFMEGWVRALSAYAHYFTSGSCRSHVKRQICAQVYNPCVENVIADDFSTYVLPYYLPFKRPSRHLCEAASCSYMGTDCVNSMDANFGAYGATEFDPNNGTSNMLYSTEGVQTVASPNEPYVGSVCKGIITEWMVPSTYELFTTAPANLAPLLPPYYLQAIREKEYSDIIATIPQYMTPDCNTGVREMLCSLKFMKPHPVNAVAFIFGAPTYVTSFPSNDLCQKYSKVCTASAMYEYNEIFDSLKFDCDSLTGPYNLFPKEDQIIVTYDFGFGPIDFASPPFTPETTVVYETQCPIGTVPRIEYNVNTIYGCNIACPLPLFDEEGVESIERNVNVYWFGLLIYGLAAYNVYITPKGKANEFFVIILSLYTLQMLVYVLIANLTTQEALMCYDDQTVYNYENYSESWASFPCVFQAIIELLVECFSDWASVCVICELFCRVVLSMKDITNIKKKYTVALLIIPLTRIILRVIVLDGKDVRFTESVVFCLFCHERLEKNAPSIDMWAKYVVPLVVTSFCFAAMIAVGYKCILISKKIAKSGENLFVKIINTYRVLFAFAIFLIIYQGYVAFTIIKSFNTYTDKAWDVWYKCLFSNFVVYANDNSVSVCGNTPSSSNSFTAADYSAKYLYSVLFLTTPFFVITLTKDSIAFWGGLINKITGNKGKKIAVSEMSNLSLGSEKESSYVSGQSSVSAHESVNESVIENDEEDDEAEMKIKEKNFIQYNAPPQNTESKDDNV